MPASARICAAITDRWLVHRRDKRPSSPRDVLRVTETYCKTLYESFSLPKRLIYDMRSTGHNHQILEIANQVAYHHCLTTKWSTWHSWNYYSPRRATVATPASPPETRKDSTCSPTAPYGSCVEIAIQTTKSLRERLAQNLDLRSHASMVKTLARASSTNPDRLTHCLTALLMDDCCIIIDLSFNFAAVKIDLGEHADSLPSITFTGQESQTRLTYTSSETAPSKRELVWEPLNRTGISRVFTPLEDWEAIEQISIPMSRDTENIKGRSPSHGTTLSAGSSKGSLVSRSKSIKLQAAFEQKPEYLPSVLVCGKHVATTCRVKVEFSCRRVTVQVPFKDWLLLERNKDIYDLLNGVQLLHTVNDTAANLVLDLNSGLGDSNIDQNIDAIARTTACLGLKEREFRDIVGSVYEVWAPLGFN